VIIVIDTMIKTRTSWKEPSQKLDELSCNLKHKMTLLSSSEEEKTFDFSEEKRIRKITIKHGQAK
jgi:hypothetical protein